MFWPKKREEGWPSTIFKPDRCVTHNSLENTELNVNQIDQPRSFFSYRINTIKTRQKYYYIKMILSISTESPDFFKNLTVAVKKCRLERCKNNNNSLYSRSICFLLYIVYIYFFNIKKFSENISISRKKKMSVSLRLITVNGLAPNKVNEGKEKIDIGKYFQRGVCSGGKR